MSGSWFTALLGKVFGNDVEFELQQGVNFKGAGVTVSANPTTKLLDVTIPGGGGGGGGGGHTIEDEGTPLTARTSLNFTGANVTASDSGGKTVVTVSGPTTAYVDGGDAAVLAAIPAVANANPADVTKAAASQGASSRYARQDHKHDAATAAPGAVSVTGVSAAEGSATSLARSDHTHSLTGQLPYANFVDGGACSLAGRSANTSGVQASIALGTNGFVALRRSNAVIGGLLLDENVDPAAAVAGSKIAPAFTNPVTITPPVATSGSPRALTVTGAAHTTLAASTEAPDIEWALARTVQFATGALTAQRAAKITAPTYAFVGASILTTAATLAISGPPVAGANATITNAYALWVESGAVRIGALGTGVVKANASGVLSSATVVDADVSATAAIAITKVAPGTALQQIRTNAAGTALEHFTQPALVDGGNLTNANVTKNISDGSKFTVPASTLTTSAKTLTFGVSGTPEDEEFVEIDCFVQAVDFIVKDGGTIGDTLYTVVAGTKRTVHIQYNASAGSWRRGGRGRLA